MDITAKKTYICPAGNNPLRDKDMTLREQLLEMADPAYRDFNARLIPGAGEMLGIRIPKLREMARLIARGDSWKEFVTADDCRWFEERMLQGMVIGYARCPVDEKLGLVAGFVPKIDNWALCDCFCWRLRPSERDPMWRFIQPYFHARAEYDIRFAVVMSTGNFVDREHLAPLLARLGECRCEAYYASMGVAWAVSVCFAKFPQQTMAWLSDRCPLDDTTYNRALQKIVESRRVSDADRQTIRTMKRPAK